MNKPFGFLFDNDGVLIDSSAFHWKAWELLMEEEPKLRMSLDSFVHSFGKRNDLILKEQFPDVSADILKKWAERKEEIFRKEARSKVTLLPGMEAFLQKVQKAGIPRIIASSTPLENLQMYIESTVLGKYFDLYLSAEQLPHGKPFPDIFLAAAKELHLPPPQCVVFEDAPAGIQAGKAAGCFVVALATTHSKQRLSDYDLIYPSPHELDLEEILDVFLKTIV